MSSTKKNNSKAPQIIAAIIAASGFVALAIDEVFKPFLDDYPEVKLIIILTSVISAYHEFLTFSVRSMFKEEIEEIKSQITAIDSKISQLKNTIPYSALDGIEFRHGHENKGMRCEMWIIANMLQEARNDDSMLLTIYENITRNNINYYYILPDTTMSNLEIAGLKSRLTDIHKRRRGTITGAIRYSFDKGLSNLIASEYFDIVLFVDCDSDGNPSLLGGSAKCEGFQCYSESSPENNYFYHSIDRDKIIEIRNYHLSERRFDLLVIGADD